MRPSMTGALDRGRKAPSPGSATRQKLGMSMQRYCKPHKVEVQSLLSSQESLNSLTVEINPHPIELSEATSASN